jgi:hypothetical protein
VAKRIYLIHFFQVCIEDTLPTAICQLCCHRLEEFNSFALKVEEVQQNIHEMVCSLNCCTTNRVSRILGHRNVQSDQIVDLSKEGDVNKSMNNSEILHYADSHVPVLRNDIEIKTSKNPSQTHVMDNSCHQLSHLQEQCFAAADTESESINQINVEYIKLEADPLQMENDGANSAIDTVQVFADSIKCETLASELVSGLLSSDTKCEYTTQANAVCIASDTPSQILEYRSNTETADKTLIPIGNLRNKCNESSVSKEGESDAEEVQDSIAAKFWGSTRNTAASSEQGSKRYIFVVQRKKTLCLTFCFTLQLCEHLFACLMHKIH